MFIRVRKFFCRYRIFFPFAHTIGTTDEEKDFNKKYKDDVDDDERANATVSSTSSFFIYLYFLLYSIAFAYQRMRMVCDSHAKRIRLYTSCANGIRKGK